MEQQQPELQPEGENSISAEKISKKGMQLFFIIQAVVLVLAIFSLIAMGGYGWTLFCIIPFSLGITTGVYTRTYRSKKILRGVFIVLLLLCGLCGILLLSGVEGAICILMAAGLIMLPSLLGMAVGYLIRNAHKIVGLVLIVLLNSSAYIYDKTDTDRIESTTSAAVLINASTQKVWEVLTHPVAYTQHKNIFFKAGVSYPTAMSVSTREGQCFLACRLNNGLIDLPITQMDSLKLLRFSLPAHVMPMKELSVYDSVHAEHLEGYFKPVYGEFSITPTGQSQCRLQAETRYTYKITPVFYWRWWSDYLINTMHLHVLTDIKATAEKKNP